MGFAVGLTVGCVVDPPGSSPHNYAGVGALIVMGALTVLARSWGRLRVSSWASFTRALPGDEGGLWGVIQRPDLFFVKSCNQRFPRSHY